MGRSHSRSPKWKHRSLSPTPKKSEHSKQRCSNEQYCSDSRKDLRRSASRMSHKKHVQSKPRIPSREDAHYRSYEHRSPSPDVRSSPDDFYSHKFYQAHSPRRDSSRSQYPSRYSEDVHYQDYCRGYPEKKQGGYTPDDHRVRSGIGVPSPQRSMADSLRFEGKWHEDESSHQRMQDEKHCQSLRRGSEDFEKWSVFQTRYLEDRDCRKYRQVPERSSGEKRFEDNDPSRNSHRRSRPNPLPYLQKKEPRHLGHRAHRAHRHGRRKPPEASSVAMATRDYHHEHEYPETSDEDQGFSDGQTEKFSKEKNRKYLSQIGLAKTHSSYVNARRDRETEDGQVQEDSEPFKSDYTPSTDSDKSNVILRPYIGKRKRKRNKERDGKRQKNSSSDQFDEREHSSASLWKKSKSLIVKIDLKKTVNTPRKFEDLDPVFGQLDSTQNPENKATEFAQEIITVIHETKANHFPSRGISLHERFSKIQDTQATEGAKETKPTLDPEMCRKIDMCLAELRNKNTVCGSEQVRGYNSC